MEFEKIEKFWFAKMISVRFFFTKSFKKGMKIKIDDLDIEIKIDDLGIKFWENEFAKKFWKLKKNLRNIDLQKELVLGLRNMNL